MGGHLCKLVNRNVARGTAGRRRHAHSWLHHTPGMQYMRLHTPSTVHQWQQILSTAHVIHHTSHPTLMSATAYSRLACMDDAYMASVIQTYVCLCMHDVTYVTQSESGYHHTTTCKRCMCYMRLTATQMHADIQVCVRVLTRGTPLLPLAARVAPVIQICNASRVTNTCHSRMAGTCLQLAGQLGAWVARHLVMWVQARHMICYLGCSWSVR